MITKSILALESSCDETSVSIVQGRFSSSSAIESPAAVKVLAHYVESQTSHLAFGGVVPEVAARDHLLKITPLAMECISRSGINPQDLDGIAVTSGPGLIGALMVGSLFAQGLSLALKKPLLAINHVDAHLAPALMLNRFSPETDLQQWIDIPAVEFPALALTVSGGHCHLSLLKSPIERVILGHTADDACGEAFDKVAKLLGLPYPGGPHLEKLALLSDNHNQPFKFTSTLADKNNRYGFSYSGIKTQVLDVVRRQLGHPQGRIDGSTLPLATKANIASAFQEAALGQLADRVQNALRDFPDTRTLLVAGGVAANGVFREKMKAFEKLRIRFAPLSLCSDNATMIGLHALLPGTMLASNHPFSRYSYPS
ncbi:MAG: tRNA (adenosine(37)-N6)-threonylcarbamoyltransferase complex transferase subunit TsaD [Silvanigrellaceae bacterium]